MAKKKRTVRKDNILKKLIEDEKAQEAKHIEKVKAKAELREERKAELLEKLQKVADGLDPSAVTTAAGIAQVDASGDVAMKPAGKASKQGVIRKIGKTKGKVRANKALLKVAKQQGVIHNIEMAQRLLEGKKVRKFTPDGQERKRDKRLRIRREKRERKCGKPKRNRSDSDDES
mmetsp:Transcript_79930/g.232038  ORF Transcript_79930/g.232038 Transcript_79930/m.232038 type:complete len:174 (+) Transcript_79930:52-573(+)